jgi:SOS-response transcriptional repressor LexA
VRLQAANPEYPDRWYHPSSIEIQGRVVAVIRRLSMN